MKKTVVDMVTNIIGLLAELEDVMKAEGERNFIRGVNGCMDLLSNIDELAMSEIKGKCLDAISIYYTMANARGGLGDFFIWRDSLDDRVAANSRLKVLIKKLSESVFALESLLQRSG